MKLRNLQRWQICLSFFTHFVISAFRSLLLGILADKIMAYFAMQVIYARRKCKISPPLTTGPQEFERIFRAQANCSEYFPIFLSLLWVSGVFSNQALAAFCGLIYLYARYQYFVGYAHSAQER
uniref:Leukotriene C4 synthase n=1 Tax=Anolis carolinensis TaxID=28377 RepID=R4GBF4_ANOCA